MVNSVSALVMGEFIQNLPITDSLGLWACFHKEHLSKTIEVLQTVILLTIVICIKKENGTVVFHTLLLFACPLTVGKKYFKEVNFKETASPLLNHLWIH